MTDYHAKLLAYELARRRPSDSVEKLAAVLSDAQVDLNSHQVEAALFAFKSLFSKGAIQIPGAVRRGPSPRSKPHPSTPHELKWVPGRLLPLRARLL